MSIVCCLEQSQEWVEPISRVLFSSGQWDVIGPTTRWSGAMLTGLAQRPDVYLVGFESVNTLGLGLLRKVLRHDRGAWVLALVPEDKGLAMASLQEGARGVCFRSEIMSSLLKGLRQVSQGEHYLSPACTRLTINEWLAPRPLQSVAVHQMAKAALTPKETEIMGALRMGRPTKSIASSMDISVYTVNQHLRSIYRKLNVHNRMEAVNLAHLSELIR